MLDQSGDNNYFIALFFMKDMLYNIFFFENRKKLCSSFPSHLIPMLAI